MSQISLTMKHHLSLAVLLVLLAAIAPVSQAQAGTYQFQAQLAGVPINQTSLITGSGNQVVGFPGSGPCYIQYLNGAYSWGVNVTKIPSSIPLSEAHLHVGNLLTTDGPGAMPPLVAILRQNIPAGSTFYVPFPTSFTPVGRNNVNTFADLSNALSVPTANGLPAPPFVNVFCDIHSTKAPGGSAGVGGSALRGQLKLVYQQQG